MNNDKLKELYKIKCKNANLCLAFGLPTILCVMGLFLMCIISEFTGTFQYTLLSMLVGGIIIFGSVACVFGFKEEKYINIIEDYIIIKVREIIQNNNIDTRNFEIINDKDWKEFKVAFHNQNIDYDNLQNQIDNALNTMNAIAGTAIRVKLI